MLPDSLPKRDWGRRRAESEEREGRGVAKGKKKARYIKSLNKQKTTQHSPPQFRNEITKKESTGNKKKNIKNTKFGKARACERRRKLLEVVSRN